MENFLFRKILMGTVRNTTFKFIAMLAAFRISGTNRHYMYNRSLMPNVLKEDPLEAKST